MTGTDQRRRRADRLNELVIDESNVREGDVTDAACAHTLRFPSVVLGELGGCGEYVRRHQRLFPTETFPKGPAVTEEVCRRHADEWNWEWAGENMLTWEGRDAWRTLIRSRSSDNRRFGTGTEREAATFGHLFETRPDYRNQRMVDLLASAAEREDRRRVQTLEDARQEVAILEREAAEYDRLATRSRERLAERRAALPDLERAAAGALARQAERDLEQAEAQATAYEAQLTTARAEVERRRAQLDALLGTDEAPTDEVAAT